MDLGVVRSGVRLMALRQLGDPVMAEEVAQESLARAVVAVEEGRLEDPARFGAFVRGIARHVVIDVMRERSAARTVPLPTAAPSTEPDPLTALISTEERQRVRAALGRLSEADRELLRLCYFEGVAPGRIAALLGEPGTRIRKRKSRALARLRAAFVGGPDGSRSDPPDDSLGEWSAPTSMETP